MSLDNYKALEESIIEWGGVEVAAMNVYSDIFNLGFNEIQKENEAPGAFKANPLGYFKYNDSQKGHYRIMFDDTFEKTLKELQEADFAILNGLTYFGRKNVQDHASTMRAMIFDLDGTDAEHLGNFFSGAFRGDAYPVPNYVVMSGHNIHLYYVFEYAIPLYPNIKLQLKELKFALTRKLWNPYTTTIEKPQYQGINQGFRVIGGKTKVEGRRVRAFKLNDHPFNLETLGKYVPEESRLDESKLFKMTFYTLEEAKKKFPDWYERRVVKKEPKGSWECKRDLYDWWIRQIQKGASHGHRYFCIMCLAIYGVKCGIPFEEVKKDAYDLIPFLNSLNENEPFTEHDVNSALECYDSNYVTFPREDVSKLTAIPIQSNKRNGRPQKLHLQGARAIQKINDEFNGTNWRDGNGRKPKKDIVEQWRSENPDGRKADCHRDTGIDPKTIRKWWDKVEIENN